jgi:large subunit ribosomal protein L29
MKAKEQVAKARDMSVDELRRQDEEIVEQMFRLRFQWAMGQSETLKRMLELRKERARVLTVIREKESEKTT